MSQSDCPIFNNLFRDGEKLSNISKINPKGPLKLLLLEDIVIHVVYEDHEVPDPFHHMTWGF